jgi:hypothetical protein
VGGPIAFIGASYVLKVIVDEQTKPIHDIPTIDPQNPYENHWADPAPK